MSNSQISHLSGQAISQLNGLTAEGMLMGVTQGKLPIQESTEGRMSTQCTNISIQESLEGRNHSSVLTIQCKNTPIQESMEGRMHRSVLSTET